MKKIVIIIMCLVLYVPFYAQETATSRSIDTYFDKQWGLKNIVPNGGRGVDIKAEEAWAITEGSPSIKIAVIDDGVDMKHPDLKRNTPNGYDATGNNSGGNPVTVYDNHGTSVAGVIGAEKDNGIGIAGVAPSCTIYPVKFCEENPFGTYSKKEWIIKQ